MLWYVSFIPPKGGSCRQACPPRRPGRAIPDRFSFLRRIPYIGRPLGNADFPYFAKLVVPYRDRSSVSSVSVVRLEPCSVFDNAGFVF